MGLIVDYSDLEAVGRSINRAANSWMEGLESVAGSAQALGGSGAMHGQAAENVKAYISTVHSSIVAAFAEIITAHAQNYVLYKQDYQSGVDTALHAKILQDELSTIQEKLLKNLQEVQDIDQAVKGQLNNISDIVHIPFPGSGTVEDEEGQIATALLQLSNQISDLENRHIGADFENTDSLIQSLEQMLQQQLSYSRSYKLSFNVQTLAADPSFLPFIQDLQALHDAQDRKADAIALAYSQEDAWQAALMEERAREAAIINGLVTGLCIIASIVIIAGTAGAGAPLAVAVISGCAGAVSSGVQSLTSQYVVNGDWSSTDWGQVGDAALLGGATGFVTGYIGSAGSQAITSALSKIQPVSHLLNSASTMTRVTTNFAIGASAETVTGMGSRFVGTMIATDGDLDAAWDAASDVKSILIDVGIGGTTNAVRGIKPPETSAESFVRRVESGEIELETPLQKGNYGEMKADQYWKSKGYSRISLDEVTDLNAPTHKGIDGVYYNPDGHPPYVISEAKFGSAKLGKTLDGPQMSRTWIERGDRLADAVGPDMADKILAQGYGSVLTRVKADGSVTTQLLDEFGKIVK